ncbi:MAG: Cobyrinic acid ac-diamide synthase [Nitrospirae bacterium]|jgi:CO dehydrogenase maturation factor|nr:Cobyrinic acid ac-diamide synthase [Nitrospirota bacterium]
MAFVLAFAGKGGTGKTTLAGLTVRYIIEKRKVPVLAVDADSNNCLHEVLGVDVHATIGDLREDSIQLIRRGAERPGGMSMEQIFDYQVQQSLVESKGFDLMVMGRPEGPGCYCAANNIIRKYTDQLSENYPYVVIDNEAGMEHLSRRTTHKVNILLIISDPTVRGIHTAKRIDNLVDELNLEIDKRVVVINRAAQNDSPELKKRAEREGLPIAGIIPLDAAITSFDLQGKPVFHLSDDAEAIQALFNILDILNIP